MSFLSIPDDYAPLYTELPYLYRHQTAGQTLDARLRIALASPAATTDEQVSIALRLFDTDQTRIDVAPYLRGLVAAQPLAVGTTGFATPDDRLLAVQMAIGTAAAPERRFIPARQAVACGALLSERPLQRIIGPQDCDEITVRCTNGCRAVLHIVRGSQITDLHYETATGGIAFFRLNVAEFTADRLELTLTADASTHILSYTVADAGPEACRIAWLGSLGGIEYYTFPVVERIVRSADRARMQCGGATVRIDCRSRECAVLRSAFETAGMLRALAGIVDSPAVWKIERNACRPMEIVTDSLEYFRHGTLQQIALEIRPTRNDERL